jgi:hypothetical protein
MVLSLVSLWAAVKSGAVSVPVPPLKQSMPTSGGVFITLFCPRSSRYEYRFNCPASANRLKSLRGVGQWVRREQRTGIHSTACQKFHGRFVVRVVAGVAEQQGQLSAHRGSRRKSHLLSIKADYNDRSTRPHGFQSRAQRLNRSGTLDPHIERIIAEAAFKMFFQGVFTQVRSPESRTLRRGEARLRVLPYPSEEHFRTPDLSEHCAENPYGSGT